MSDDPQQWERQEMRAEVRDVVLSAESQLFVIVVLSFENKSGRPLRVLRYWIRWAGGGQEVQPADLRLPPYAVVERRLHLGPDSGDLQQLLADVGATLVEVRVREDR